VGLVQPGIVSALSGSYEEKRIGRFSLLPFCVVCGATTAAEYHIVAKFLLGMDRPWD
jgi:hypothetical protein